MVSEFWANLHFNKWFRKLSNLQLPKSKQSKKSSRGRRDHQSVSINRSNSYLEDGLSKPGISIWNLIFSNFQLDRWSRASQVLVKRLVVAFGCLWLWFRSLCFIRMIPVIVIGQDVRAIQRSLMVYNGRSNQPPAKFCLKSDSNCILIKFFDPISAVRSTRCDDSIRIRTILIENVLI